jgi:hypothetical protein
MVALELLGRLPEVGEHALNPTPNTCQDLSELARAGPQVVENWPSLTQAQARAQRTRTPYIDPSFEL